MAEVFARQRYPLPASQFQEILLAEQRAYLEAMELPTGTARNAALLENVFVMLVCILNKIPLFLVGKPGITTNR